MKCEKEIIENFFKVNKKERAQGLFSSKKKRKKILNELAHGNYFEDKYILSIKSNKQNFDDIYGCLKENGVNEICYVISENPALDGKELNLKDVLEEVIGYGMSTIISFTPPEIAYFEGEGERFFLSKTDKFKQSNNN